MVTLQRAVNILFYDPLPFLTMQSKGVFFYFSKFRQYIYHPKKTLIINCIHWKTNSNFYHLSPLAFHHRNWHTMSILW